MAYQGQSVHIPCAFSIVETLSVLYSSHLKFNPNNAADPTRDYLILSKGHGVMALYACLREMNWVTENDLTQYFKDGSRLHGLSESHIPGCEVTSGSLGHGLPIAVGIAKGLVLQGKSAQHVYCIVGDGEMNEGSMWESLLFAAHHRLSNLTVIVDANQFQAMGKTEDVLGMEPFADKFKAFGFQTFECNGHSTEALNSCFRAPHTDRPKAIIARTKKGYGVSFMELNNVWHYSRLDANTYQKALAEIDAGSGISESPKK